MKTKFKIGKKIKRISTNEEGEVVGYSDDIYYQILIKINGKEGHLKITSDGRYCQTDNIIDFEILD